jgi:hypothetical protein
MNQWSSLVHLVFFTVALVVLVLLGLVFVPMWDGSPNLVAAQGTTVTVNPGSYAFVPFSVSQTSRISGSLASNAQVDVFIVNSTQFENSGPYPPASGYVFSSGYAESLGPLQLT